MPSSIRPTTGPDAVMTVGLLAPLRTANSSISMGRSRASLRGTGSAAMASTRIDARGEGDESQQLVPGAAMP